MNLLIIPFIVLSLLSDITTLVLSVSLNDGLNINNKNSVNNTAFQPLFSTTSRSVAAIRIDNSGNINRIYNHSFLYMYS